METAAGALLGQTASLGIPELSGLAAQLDSNMLDGAADDLPTADDPFLVNDRERQGGKT